MARRMASAAALAIGYSNPGQLMSVLFASRFVHAW